MYDNILRDHLCGTRLPTFETLEFFRLSNEDYFEKCHKPDLMEQLWRCGEKFGDRSDTFGTHVIMLKSSITPGHFGVKKLKFIFQIPII